VQVLVGSRAEIPCDLSVPQNDEPNDDTSALWSNPSLSSEPDSVELILWYHNDLQSPIYNVDARSTGSNKLSESHKQNVLADAKHYAPAHGNDRIKFNLSTHLTPIQSGSQAMLLIDAVRPTDSGEYRCRVDFRRARTVNQITRLNVVVPVSSVALYDHNERLLNGPTAGPYENGTTVNISCRALDGQPNATIVWLRHSKSEIKPHYIKQYVSDNKNDIFNVENILVNGDRLVIERVTDTELNDIFTCRAFNTLIAPAIQRSISLQIYAKPKHIEIVSQTEHDFGAQKIHKLAAGNRVEYVCQTTGSRPPARIAWFKNTEQIAPINVAGESTSDSGLTTTSLLSFVATHADNQKSLICEAFNPHLRRPNNAIRASIQLHITYAPIVTIVSDKLQQLGQNNSVTEGTTLELVCHVKANPEADTVRWFINELPFGNDNSTTTVSSVNIDGTRLLINNLTARSYRSFKCEAKNLIGSGSSDSLNIDVQYPPRCSPTDTAPAYMIGSTNRSVTCPVIGNPLPTLFNWTLLPFNRPSEMLATTSTYSLELSSKLKLENGKILCSANNIIGSQIEPCEILIKPSGVPDPPSNCDMKRSNTSASVTSVMIVIECIPGHDGGSPQTFNAALYDTHQKNLIRNLPSSREPRFVIEQHNIVDNSGDNAVVSDKTDLPSVLIYASNVIGSSRVVMLDTASAASQITGQQQLYLDGPLQMNSSSRNSKHPIDPGILSNMLLVSASVLLFVLLLSSVTIFKRNKSSQNNSPPSTASTSAPDSQSSSQSSHSTNENIINNNNNNNHANSTAGDRDFSQHDCNSPLLHTIDDNDTIIVSAMSDSRAIMLTGHNGEIAHSNSNGVSAFRAYDHNQSHNHNYSYHECQPITLLSRNSGDGDDDVKIELVEAGTLLRLNSYNDSSFIGRQRNKLDLTHLGPQLEYCSHNNLQYNDHLHNQQQKRSLSGQHNRHRNSNNPTSAMNMICSPVMCHHKQHLCRGKNTVSDQQQQLPPLSADDTTNTANTLTPLFTKSCTDTCTSTSINTDTPDYRMHPSLDSLGTIANHTCPHNCDLLYSFDNHTRMDI
ncbi:Cell adhesion molecule 2, partial [Fragariocoptes setiger]